MAEEKRNLDGRTPIKPTPFDAHEQASRGQHVPSGPNSPDKNPRTVQEFPKAVDHVDKDGAPEGHKEPIVVKSSAEEKAYQEAKAADEKAAS